MGGAIFVMISGALFLNGNHSIEKIYKKSIARIVLAFVFWSMIYTAVSMAVTHLRGKQALKEFLLGHYHMWFLFMIVGLYMIVPLLKQIVSSMELVKYFLLLSLVFAFVIPQTIAVVSLKFPGVGSLANNMIGKMAFHFTLGYAGYFIAGYYLSKIELSKRMKGIIYFLGLCGLLLTIVSTSILSASQKKADVMFYGNLTVNTLVESIAVFVLAKDLFSGRIVRDKIKDVLGVLSKYSFGAYLIHALVLEELGRLFGLHTLSFFPVVSVPVISIIVFVVSFVLSGILNHIPFIKKVV